MEDLPVKTPAQMNRAEKRRYFNAYKRQGVEWSDFNNPIPKRKPYINDLKRENRRAYIKARRLNG